MATGASNASNISLRLIVAGLANELQQFYWASTWIVPPDCTLEHKEITVTHRLCPVEIDLNKQDRNTFSCLLPRQTERLKSNESVWMLLIKLCNRSYRLGLISERGYQTIVKLVGSKWNKVNFELRLMIVKWYVSNQSLPKRPPTWRIQARHS